MTPPGPARFDDLRAGTGLRFAAPSRILAAYRPADVVPVLEAVEAATARGKWAYGFVAYEAAAAYGLDVHPEPPEGLPLVWFGVTDQPQEAISSTSVGEYDVHWREHWSRTEYHGLVHRVREKIAAGETYQTNLTVRVRGPFFGDPSGLYRDLCSAQRGPCHARLDTGRFVIASASPELFFERRGDELLLRPMKGTAPAGPTPSDDRARARELRSDEKERAENIMIVDLMRNDVARVAVPGSVAVPSLLRVERYPTVLQLTSEVTARMRPGTGLPDLFAALFPCGSVTGAPKARTMTLIRELENTPRGVYCGAIGWAAPPSAPVRSRFSVAIRTAVVDRAAGTAEYGVGGGITWGSSADAEHRELLAKAQILRRDESLARVPVGRG